MDKFDILVKRALDGKYISESLKDSISKNMFREINESSGSKSVNIDKNDNINARDDKGEYMNDTTDEKTNNIIKSLLDTIIEYLRKNGPMLKILNRVIGTNTKEDAFPLVSLCSKDGISETFYMLDNSGINYFEGDNVNSGLVGDINKFLDKKHYCSDNKTRSAKKLLDLDNLNIIFQKFSGENNVMTKRGNIGKGEFLLGCICNDLTMSVARTTKNKGNNTIPDLKDINSDKGHLIEVKNCNELKPFEYKYLYYNSDNVNHKDNARLKLNITLEAARECDKYGVCHVLQKIAERLEACFKDENNSLFIWCTNGGKLQCYNIYNGNFEVEGVEVEKDVNELKEILDNKDNKDYNTQIKNCKLFKVTSSYGDKSKPFYLEWSESTPRIFIFK